MGRNWYCSRPRCLVAANDPGEGLILAHKPSVSNRSVRRRSTAEAADGCHIPLPANVLKATVTRCADVRDCKPPNPEELAIKAEAALAVHGCRTPATIRAPGLGNFTQRGQLFAVTRIGPRKSASRTLAGLVPRSRLRAGNGNTSKEIRVTTNLWRLPSWRCGSCSLWRFSRPIIVGTT